MLEKIGESVTTTGRGFYLLRNFPVSEAILSREELVAAWFGVGLYWGRAVSQNAKGHVVGHVKRLDSADASDPDVRIYATSAAQPWHVDDADLVALLCLRKATCVGGGGGSESVEGDRSEDSTVAVNADDDSSDDTGDDTGDTNNGINESTGQTKRTENTKEKNKSASGGRGGLSRWVSSLSVYNKLLGERPDLVRELSRPFAFDKRGEVAPGTSPFVEVPVLTVHEGTLTFVFNDEYIRSAQRHAGATPLTPEMEEAIRAVTEAAESRELHLEWDLEPGDVQVSVVVCVRESEKQTSFFLFPLPKTKTNIKRHLHAQEKTNPAPPFPKQLIWNWSQLHTRTAYDDPPAFGERRHLLRLWLEAHGVRHPFPPAFPRQAHGGIPSSDGVLRAPLDAE